MAATYMRIASTTLTTTAASVTFSGIPQTYTDLIIRLNGRCDAGGFQDTLNVRINGLTTSIYSGTRLRGTGTSVSSTRNSNATVLFGGGGFINGSASTASTFSNCEIYFANYTGSQDKVVSTFSITTRNGASDNEITAQSGLVRTSSAITEISLIVNSTNFVSGSTFHLYGIKNS